jgi:hypothetical protein
VSPRVTGGHRWTGGSPANSPTISSRSSWPRVISCQRSSNGHPTTGLPGLPGVHRCWSVRVEQAGERAAHSIEHGGVDIRPSRRHRPVRVSCAEKRADVLAVGPDDLDDQLVLPAGEAARTWGRRSPPRDARTTPRVARCAGRTGSRGRSRPPVPTEISRLTTRPAGHAPVRAHRHSTVTGASSTFSLGHRRSVVRRRSASATVAVATTRASGSRRVRCRARR